MRLTPALFALALAAGGLGASAQAQSSEDCTAYGDDAIAARACAARELEAADGALSEARSELRELLAERGAVDGRRDTAALDVTTAAWRSWRDAECALRASITPDQPESAAPVICAAAMTRERVGAIQTYISALGGAVDATDEAPVSPPESPPVKPEAPEAELVADASFGDWRNQCWSDGLCDAVTRIATPDGDASLIVSRIGWNTPWTIQVGFPDADETTADGVALQIDSGDAISLDEWDAAAVLELMRRGLQAHATQAEASNGPYTFSLRGLTASLRWVDETQLDERRTN